MMCRSSRVDTFRNEMENIIRSKWDTIFTVNGGHLLQRARGFSMVKYRRRVPKLDKVMLYPTKGNPKRIRFTLYPLWLPCEGTFPPPPFPPSLFSPPLIAQPPPCIVHKKDVMHIGGHAQETTICEIEGELFSPSWGVRPCTSGEPIWLRSRLYMHRTEESDKQD